MSSTISSDLPTGNPMNRDQPPPSEGEGPAIWDLVLLDIAERRKMGEQKYGRVLRAGNGHDHLIDAYQEALDLVVYLRTEIEQQNRDREEIAWLRRVVESMAARVVAQSELLSKRAEKS